MDGGSQLRRVSTPDGSGKANEQAVLMAKKKCTECHNKRKNCIPVVRRAGGGFEYVCKLCYETKGYRAHLDEYYDHVVEGADNDSEGAQGPCPNDGD